MADSARDKGLKKIAELFGEEGAKGAAAGLEKFDPGFADVVLGTCFGEVWSRPGLPTKIRSFITMAGLIALVRPAELKAHIQGALRLGITPDEIKEVIIHMSQYAGIPCSVDAMRVLAEVMQKK